MTERVSDPTPARTDWLTLPVLFLVGANLVPLYGVYVLDWHVFAILLLFWLENFVVGAFTVLRMLWASPAESLNWLVKLFMIPFFCFHYGMFTSVHGFFVVVLFGGLQI